MPIAQTTIAAIAISNSNIGVAGELELEFSVILLCSDYLVSVCVCKVVRLTMLAFHIYNHRQYTIECQYLILTESAEVPTLSEAGWGWIASEGGIAPLTRCEA